MLLTHFVVVEGGFTWPSRCVEGVNGGSPMVLVTQLLQQLDGTSPVHLVTGLRGSPWDSHVGVASVWVVVAIVHLVDTTLQGRGQRKSGS